MVVTIEENRTLKDFSTFSIGGPARYLVTVDSAEQMREAFCFAKQKNLPFLVLGKGSNCLFDDLGYEGVVIINKISFLEPVGESQFHVGSGYSFSRLGAKLAREGWSGLEFASGIPGTVGGAVFMNAGANGQETVATLRSIDFMRPDGKHEVITNLEGFGYRTSPFHEMKGAILGATFELIRCETAKQMQRDLVEYRTATQPYGTPSAGCVFRNTKEVSAGRLIEESLCKGERIGGAEVSQIHANFIVNSGGATARDVLNLAKEVEKRVWKEKGIRLERELRFIPCQEERP